LSVRLQSVPAPPGALMVAPPEVPRNASRSQDEGRAARARERRAAKGIIRAGVLRGLRPVKGERWAG
jgi:hypothetical protein